MNGNNSGGGSVFERLEGVRIEASEMQDNMSKLASFFDKYAKDKVWMLSAERWADIAWLSSTYLFFPPASAYLRRMAAHKGREHGVIIQAV